MNLKSKVKGLVVAKKTAKNGKEYLKIYAGNAVISVFQGDKTNFSSVEVGATVEVPVSVSIRDLKDTYFYAE